MSNEKDVSFEAEMERLGQIAIQARGTDDFPAAFRRLLNYFKSEDGYFRFLLIKHNQLERFNLTGQYEPDVQDEYVGGLEVAEKLLRNKIEGYDPNLRSGDKYPFFGFVNKDLYHISKDYAAEQSLINGREKNGRISVRGPLFMAKKNRILIGKINRLRDSMECSGADLETVRKICSKLDISEDKYYSLMVDISMTNTLSLDKPPADEDEDGSMHDIIADSDGYVSDSEAIRNETENDWLGFADKDREFENTLTQIDKVIRESFMEKHKRTFPYEWTNQYIVGVVEEYQQKDHMIERESSGGTGGGTGRYLNFEQAAEKYWDVLYIEDRHRYYGGGRYLCMKDEIFSWFERVKRRILAKEIAEQISGMTPSTYNKACAQAMELVRKSLAAIQ